MGQTENNRNIGNYKPNYKTIIYSYIRSLTQSRLLGFIIIFGFTEFYQNSELWSLGMFSKILGVTIGGIILINHGSKKYK